MAVRHSGEDCVSHADLMVYSGSNYSHHCAGKGQPTSWVLQMFPSQNTAGRSIRENLTKHR